LCLQVFQRRLDGSVNFYRKWEEYKNGFGSASGEFWLGNDNVHTLSTSGDQLLRVDLETFDSETRFAEYSGFFIENESNLYTLRLRGLVSSQMGKYQCRSVYHQTSKQTRELEGKGGNFSGGRYMVMPSTSSK